MQAALSQFLISEKDLGDEIKFNQELLNRRFRKLSKICHPDRPGGDGETFIQVEMNHGILQALLNNNHHKNESITTLTHEIGKIAY